MCQLLIQIIVIIVLVSDSETIRRSCDRNRTFPYHTQNQQRLTAVNEDSLDRPPYFLYYSIYANGQTWQAVNSSEKTYPQLRFLSTKAAFSWSVLINNDPYTQKLREYVQDLADQNRGYFSGKYENQNMGINKSIDVNTNAVILESLLYQARNKQPLIN